MPVSSPIAGRSAHDCVQTHSISLPQGRHHIWTYLLDLHESVMSCAPAVLALGMQECKRLLHSLAWVLQGRSVVRLKGGCPSVFSRCSSELRALAAAGCAAELVPGVSSALAAPLFAGMPLAMCLCPGSSPCSEHSVMLTGPSPHLHESTRSMLRF